MPAEILENPSGLRFCNKELNITEYNFSSQIEPNSNERRQCDQGHTAPEQNRNTLTRPQRRVLTVTVTC